MGNAWSESSLGRLIRIKHGFAFKGEFFKKTPTSDMLCTPGNFAIGGGFQLASKPKYYDGPVPADYVLQPGQLMVTMTDLSKGGDTLGYAALVPGDLSVRLLHNQRIGLVEVTEPHHVDRGFLHWFMRTRIYRNEVLASATGSTVRHTSPKRIYRIPLRLPPVAEQRRIATVLGALDAKIELNRAMNRTLEEMAQALFKSWFIDFDGHEPDTLVDSELGPVPTGWEVLPISSVVPIKGGSTPRTKNPEFWENGSIHWTTPRDLSGMSTPVLLDTARRITPLGLAKISSGLLPVGTLLLSSRAPVGYLAISEVPVAVNQGYIAMPPEGRASSLWLLHWAKNNMHRIKSRAGGTTFAEISKRNFRPIKVLLPPEPELHRFDATAGPLYRRIVANERESTTLGELRDTLLPKLISGELRVPESLDDLLDQHTEVFA